MARGWPRLKGETQGVLRGKLRTPTKQLATLMLPCCNVRGAARYEPEASPGSYR